MSRILAAGVVAILAVSASSIATYFLGHRDGEREKAQAIAMSLSDARYDVQQSAKYAGSLADQDDILRTAAGATRSLDILDRSGHFDDIANSVRRAVFPSENALEVWRAVEPMDAREEAAELREPIYQTAFDGSRVLVVPSQDNAGFVFYRDKGGDGYADTAGKGFYLMGLSKLTEERDLTQGRYTMKDLESGDVRVTFSHGF